MRSARRHIPHLYMLTPVTLFVFDSVHHKQPPAQGKKASAARSRKPAAGAAAAAAARPREECKMVLCVNTSLGMGKGKIGGCRHEQQGAGPGECVCWQTVAAVLRRAGQSAAKPAALGWHLCTKDRDSDGGCSAAAAQAAAAHCSTLQPLTTAGSIVVPAWHLHFPAAAMYLLAPAAAGAQCAHAAVGVIGMYRSSNPGLFRQWERHGQPKIALKIKDDAEMVSDSSSSRLQGLLLLVSGLRIWAYAEQSSFPRPAAATLALTAAAAAAFPHLAPPHTHTGGAGAPGAAARAAGLHRARRGAHPDSSRLADGAGHWPRTQECGGPGDRTPLTLVAGSSRSSSKASAGELGV